MRATIEPREGPSRQGCAERATRLSTGAADFIAGIVDTNRGFPARSFYGESFSALLLALGDREAERLISRLRETYVRKDKSDPSFHWEFNNYAWLTFHRHTGEAWAREIVSPLRFTGTGATNWSLLRACCRYLAGTDVEAARRESMTVLRRSQSRSGLIHDEPGVRSFQYHAFSAVLAWELFELSGDPFFRQRFTAAADFISHFVLGTGDTLYVGRGQQQSFGYGALVCLLAYAYRSRPNPAVLDRLDRCLKFLERYRRADGSFPLVLSEREAALPVEATYEDAGHPGWYRYNNCFDYLPFFAVFLRKAADTLLGAPDPPDEPPSSVATGYHDGDFVVHKGNTYEAVVGRPGGNFSLSGYWSNDLPVPYIVSGERRITPSYGGDQYRPSSYSTLGLPLPVVHDGRQQRSFRDARFFWSFLLGRRLIVLCSLGVLVRTFRFLEDRVVIDDYQASFRPCRSRFLFGRARQIGERVFEIDGGAIVNFSVPFDMAPERHTYWGGDMHALVAHRSAWRCRTEIRIGRNDESR